MHFLAVLAFIAATSPGAQQPAPADSARSESTPTAVTPTPDQKHFLDGLRTASRGIAQLKDGLSRVSRSQAGHDETSRRRAGRFLAGLCGSARAFLARGRPQMRVSAYEDSAGVKARRLTSQIDSLIAYMPASSGTSASRLVCPSGRTVHQQGDDSRVAAASRKPQAVHR